ncbi:peptidoglycan recognition protein family protein [Kitasatospora purpeofusca]|uniref:peptidoglycan recognition protein family protein n=1 Tax=Kitasatospora purpeofusca TaxID=67352 RepID=UPI0022524EFA|nr:peptidoglycan recognition family protein [Kitasatospora purpeofusca]MCX4752885.1 N-acetylmuramoyl-L-alanine amidase [Kitasatospora purpeofusca]WSR32429.1 N-acetylmuramoyl-L-alanine amidase [Kitasatospora purpeofusca]
MAWYPDAEKMELQPESDDQPAITPTQMIFHSVAAPWTPRRMYDYWHDSTNLESHFGVGYDGRVGQFVGTETRADANMHANRRADGTGAVSVETASDDHHTDPWTSLQLAALIALGAWLARRHGIPVRVCPTWDAPGFGYHRMFPQWSQGGTACPGDARARQFHDIVLPGIAQAVKAGQPPAPSTPTAPAPAPTIPEDDMPYSEADLRRFIREEASGQTVRDANAFSTFWFLSYVLSGQPIPGSPWGDLPDQVRSALVDLVGGAVWARQLPNPGQLGTDGTPRRQPAMDFQVDQDRKFDQTMAVLTAQSAAISALAAELGQQHPGEVDVDALVARIKQAIADIEIRLTATQKG